MILRTLIHPIVCFLNLHFTRPNNKKFVSDQIVWNWGNLEYYETVWRHLVTSLTWLKLSGALPWNSILVGRPSTPCPRLFKDSNGSCKVVTRSSCCLISSNGPFYINKKHLNRLCFSLRFSHLENLRLFYIGAF